MGTMPTTRNSRGDLYPDLGGLIDSLTGEFFERGMAKAQKASLKEWRDRKKPPGVHARFTHQGASYYDFPDLHKGKSGKPPYFVTGQMRDALLRRNPRKKSKKGAPVVESALKIGGGKLNFFGHHHPVESRTARKVRRRTLRRGSKVSRHIRVGGVNVSAHRRQEHILDHVRTIIVEDFDSRTYKEAFLDLRRDQRYIRDRTRDHFFMYLRKAAIGRKGLKPAFVSKHLLEEREAA